jgi:hypothetical protein
LPDATAVPSPPSDGPRRDEKTLPHFTPFVIAWMLAALYGAVLLAVAVRIGLRMTRGRSDDREPRD